MSGKAKKQLEKTEQEIQRLEREVETLRDSMPPDKACKSSIEYATRQKEPMFAEASADEPNPWSAPPNPGCCALQ